MQAVKKGKKKMVNKCFLSELGNLEATSAFGLALFSMFILFGYVASLYWV